MTSEWCRIIRNETHIKTIGSDGAHIYPFILFNLLRFFELTHPRPPRNCGKKTYFVEKYLKSLRFLEPKSDLQVPFSELSNFRRFFELGPPQFFGPTSSMWDQCVRKKWKQQQFKMMIYTFLLFYFGIFIINSTFKFTRLCVCMWLFVLQFLKTDLKAHWIFYVLKCQIHSQNVLKCVYNNLAQ